MPKVEMSRLSVAQVLFIYNFHAPKKTARFESHAIGARRLNALLAKIEVTLEDAYHAAFPATRPPVAAPVETPIAPAKAPFPAGQNLPKAPDFTANTHKPYRAKLARLIELAEAGDIAGLEAVEIKPTSSSPKAMIRYRTQVIAALAAREAA